MKRPGSRGMRPNAALVSAARIAIGVALLIAIIAVTVRTWSDVTATLDEIGSVAVVCSLGLAVAGLATSALTWRSALGELGASVRTGGALKIYLVGQLGKYIPGSVWALFLQMELASAAAVGRAQAFGAGILSIGINLVIGGAVGSAAVSLMAGTSSWRYVLAGVAFVACAAAIAPPVLSRISEHGLRLARQPPLDHRPTWGGILKASGFSFASWLFYGSSLAVLVVGAGASSSEALLVAIPAVALAMTLGFVVAAAPSGIGVREAVLVAALAPILTPSTALGVALVLRFVFTIADIVAAALVMPVRLTRDGTQPFVATGARPGPRGT